ncbi:MAG: efflux transporter outer membrane subunit [bacterium]|nr:efflux transporter outer membrane subunit [bacterium]
MKHIFILIPLFLTACASAPRVRPPALEVEVPQTWTSGALSDTPQDTLWWTQFGDARLNSLIAEAFDHNHNLQATAARLHAAQAQAKIAGAPLYPQLSAGANGSKRKQNFIGFPLPGNPDGVPSTTSKSYGISLNASWEIDLWGKLRAGQAAALAAFQASQANLQGARLSLAAQTAKAWFAAIEARRQAELARATVENYQTSFEQVRNRYNRGIRPSLDLRLTQADYASALDRLHQREQLYDRAVRQLEILLGKYPRASLSVTEDLPVTPDEVPAGLPADLISRRPDLVAAERQLAASHAQLVSARRALYPRISLTASGGTISNQLGDLLNGDFKVWSIVGNMLQPLFQGGRIRGNINLAKSRADETLALYAQSVLRAYAEVELALAAENFLGQRQAALETATEQSLAARSLAEDRYNRGLSDLITMLSAQRIAYQAESQLLTVRRLRLEARINLHLALGGGFTRETLWSSNATPTGAPVQ